MIIKHRDSGNRSGDFDAAGHDWWWYVVDYNTQCMSIEKWILFHELVVYQWVHCLYQPDFMGQTLTIPLILLYCMICSIPAAQMGNTKSGFANILPSAL